MTKLFNNKGFSLIEILIAIVITSVILGAVLMSFESTLRVFRDAKSISDNIETKTPSIELISRYFDRWGVGVVSRVDKTDCNTNVCPVQRKSLTITTSGGCSDITFWGNIHGSGYVKDLSIDLTTANLYSCRLASSPSNRNCYIVWSNNQPMNPVVEGHVDPVSLPTFTSGVSNADCSNLPTGGSLSVNVTMPSTLNTSTNLVALRLQSGDVIHRTPHRIRLYCNSNPNDGGRRWLYVDLTELSNGFCNDAETASPIAPVEIPNPNPNNLMPFQVTALPNGCNAANGDCRALNVSITFRSPSPRHGGQFDTYTVTKVFGR